MPLVLWMFARTVPSPFWNGSEFPHEIGELLQMPAVAFVILPAVAATLLTRFPAISKLMA